MTVVPMKKAKQKNYEMNIWAKTNFIFITKQNYMAEK